MGRRVALILVLCGAVAGGSTAPPLAAHLAAAPPTPVQVYGAWHCSNDYCTWGAVRSVADFDAMNHWLVDRGDGRPSVNLVVLSFVHPLKLLNGTTDATTTNGVPKGMTPEIVQYFTSRGVRVMVSIGGITYTSAWNQALAKDPALLGRQAAALATRFGVGVEIDYEENRSPNLAGLQAFIDAYRAVHPYDAAGVDPAARLTIDLAAGDRWLIALTRKATADWLRTDLPVLDYANAMVPAKQPSTSAAIANWQEHIDGKPQYAPPVPPLAPAKFTGGLYLKGNNANCRTFDSSEQKAYATYVQTVAPNGAGSTNGMLGYMFWAAEYPSSRRGYVATIPPNSCEGGMGVAATTFNIPIPMPPLRQQ